MLFKLPFISGGSKIINAYQERANVCSCRNIRPIVVEIWAKILRTLIIELNGEMRFVVIGRGGAGSHAHGHQPQKLDRLVNSFRLPQKSHLHTYACCYWIIPKLYKRYRKVQKLLRFLIYFGFGSWVRYWEKMWKRKGVCWLGFHLIGKIFTKRPVPSQE